MSTPLWGAYLRWRGIAGPLADFVFPAPFLAGWLAPPLRPAAPGAERLARGLIARAVAPRTAVFLEAAPRTGLAVARHLARSGWAIAPFFGRWPEARAVLPVAPLTRWLGAPLEWAEAPPSGYCLLLDAERRRRVAPRTLHTHFDNRYEYGAQQLPPHAKWSALGVERLLWVAHAAGIPPELEDYAAFMACSGLSVEVASLAHLGGADAAS